MLALLRAQLVSVFELQGSQHSGVVRLEYVDLLLEFDSTGNYLRIYCSALPELRPQIKAPRS